MTGSRVGVARLVYAVGLVLAVLVSIDGLTDESRVEWLVGPAMGMAIWWIAGGIAARLGVLPKDFFVWVGSLVGPRSRGTSGSP